MRKVVPIQESSLSARFRFPSAVRLSITRRSRGSGRPPQPRPFVIMPSIEPTYFPMRASANGPAMRPAAAAFRTIVTKGTRP